MTKTNKENQIKLEVKDLIKYKVKDRYSGSSIVFMDDSNTDYLYSIKKMNIKTLNGESISWYDHDVFKKLNYIYWDPDSGSEYPEFYLEEDKLYSKTKLRKLKRSKNFKERNFAFFNYGLVERLLGLEPTSEGLSGLFK